MMRRYQAQVEAILTQTLGDDDLANSQLLSAMRYATLNGGKRLRAILVYSVGDVYGLKLASLNFPAMAVELIHAYSLVHDDLPAMDDDDLRRGKPSCHKAYDEATAILAGDSLQSFAFELLSSSDFQVSSDSKVAMVAKLAHAIGGQGMVLGQALDLAGEGNSMQLADIEQIHCLKTGALLQASIELPLLMVSDLPTDQWQAWTDFGRNLGLAFQVIDDILDITATTETLGKQAGRDQCLQKATYPGLLGVEGAQALAVELYEKALGSLKRVTKATDDLEALASFIVERTF